MYEIWWFNHHRHCECISKIATSIPMSETGTKWQGLMFILYCVWFPYLQTFIPNWIVFIHVLVGLFQFYLLWVFFIWFSSTSALYCGLHKQHNFMCSSPSGFSEAFFTILFRTFCANISIYSKWLKRKIIKFNTYKWSRMLFITLYVIFISYFFGFVL